MTTRTKAMTMFTAWADVAAQAAINDERGLGAQFDDAVKALVSENPTATPKELTLAFDEAMTAIETQARSKLVEVFGDKATLSKHSPNFRQYKSDYRGLIVLAGVNVADYNGPYNVKKAKAKLSNPTKEENKGPEGSASTDGDASGTTPAKGGSTPEHSGLPKSVQDKLDNATLALSKMSEKEALEIVTHFENKAWSSLKAGNKKMRSVA